jgi:hypothetical protein
MRALPTVMIRVLSSFVPLFSRRVWPHVQVLLIGAILTPGKRTVSSALHAMGLSQEERFHRYHRVLSRARWSSREVSRALLGLLVEMFVAEGDPLVVGIDETIERRYGRKISAKGVYRDPVRSTHENFVKASVPYGGCARCCRWRSLGPLEFGPCLSFLPWHLPNVMPPSRANDTRR